VDRAVAMVQKHRNKILGIKVRLTKHMSVSEQVGMKALYLAREAADLVKLPIMVHPQSAWCDSIDDILQVMKKGDVLTHCFHGIECGVLDSKKRVRKSVWEAVERGVIFDVGHGRSSFRWDVCEHALEQGFVPNIISSDIHRYNFDGPVYDLTTTVNKFLCLGLSLNEVISRVTEGPACFLQKPEELGTLKCSAFGDAVILRLEKGTFEFLDTHGEVRIGSERLVPVMVVKDGRIHRDYYGRSNAK